MEPKELRETLAHLHAQLEDAEGVEAELRDDLERAMAEIREVVEESESRAQEAEETPLSERLSDLALRFEALHPSLTEAVGGVVRALSRMGV